MTGGLSGEITISGSSTVEPISIGVAEAFSGKAPGVGISVDGPGTGDGFELFCRGEIDIADASRPISDEEIEACTQAGVDFVEMKVAIDGIAVLSSPDNSEVTDCLSFSDIYALVGPESQGFNRWSAANTLAAELDNTKAAPFPNIPLSITAPGEESGTYDSFVELVLEDIAENRGKEAQSRPDYQASADDNIIVRGIQSEGGSFGWVGYAFFEANRDSVRAFEIAGEDGNCVEPSPETIADGSYPIARPLYIYANVAKVEENQALAEFLDFYLSDEGISAVTNAGYVELPEDELDFSRQSLESRRIGRQDH
ncbi:MAG TPA: substrate-binding domain-containing protein [Actinomycetota bacterium]|nr:substrate-binding domain-containing protein [Actinomycetota bacterium]